MAFGQARTLFRDFFGWAPSTRAVLRIVDTTGAEARPFLVEGAVRHLVGARLDASGMRWGKGRAEAVLQLRCVLINGLWNDFEAHLARKVGFRVKGSPARAQTHDAVTKKAA